jgi:hypothetical protein
MAPLPDLHLRHTHLLITKTLLTLYELDLTPNESSAGTIHAEGKAGTREDKSVDFKVNFERVPIVDWLPPGWKDHFSGTASGTIHWTGKNPKLESASGQGSLRIKAGRVDGLPFLKKLTSLTKNDALEHLDLDVCSLELVWDYPKVEIKNIAIEDKGKLRIEGSISIEQNSLGGSIQYLSLFFRQFGEWLKKAFGGD